MPRYETIDDRGKLEEGGKKKNEYSITTLNYS